MYAFLVESAPKDESHYQFFTYMGKQSVPVVFRGQEYAVERGMRFGVRPSANGKHIRLIFPDNKNRVFTLDLPTAQKLAKGVARERQAA